VKRTDPVGEQSSENKVIAPKDAFSFGTSAMRLCKSNPKRKVFHIYREPRPVGGELSNLSMRFPTVIVASPQHKGGDTCGALVVG